MLYVCVYKYIYMCTICACIITIDLAQLIVAQPTNQNVV